MHIKVRVDAGARRESLEQIDEDTFKVSVKEKAERNQANIRVLELIAAELGVERQGIQIITGHHHSNKILFIRNET